jgi:hypothetical protein
MGSARTPLGPIMTTVKSAEMAYKWPQTLGIKQHKGGIIYG